MKPKNLRIYRGDLKTLQEEYEEIGFETNLSGGVLTVFALRRKPEKTLAKLREARKKNERKSN